MKDIRNFYEGERRSADRTGFWLALTAILAAVYQVVVAVTA